MCASESTINDPYHKLEESFFIKRNDKKMYVRSSGNLKSIIHIVSDFIDLLVIVMLDQSIMQLI